MTAESNLPGLLAQAQGSSPTSMFIFLGLLMVGMYFLMIAPQRKKEKEHKKLLGGLKNGDKVLTIGGIFGTVTAVKDDRVHLKVDESTRIEVLKSAVQGFQPQVSTDESK